MKRLYLTVIASVFMFSAGLLDNNSAQACSFCLHHIKPVVSCRWLEGHRSYRGLVVVDIRTADEYRAGHIEGSINIPMEVPFSAWITMVDGLLLQLPDIADLSAALADNGIKRSSKIVVVTSMGEPPYPQANATRVATTLIYAGVKDVAILDGGYPQWIAEGREVSTDDPVVVPEEFTPSINETIFVDIDYVYDSIGKKIIVDARDTEVYNGEVMEEWAQKAGHIPTAVSLPAPLIWNEDGTYKSKFELKQFVRRALGPHNRYSEIIVYCGVGGYAGSWWYVLAEILGYRNVKFYDGSAQEWVLYYDMEI